MCGLFLYIFFTPNITYFMYPSVYITCKITIICTFSVPVCTIMCVTVFLTVAVVVLSVAQCATNPYMTILKTKQKEVE